MECTALTDGRAAAPRCERQFGEWLSVQAVAHLRAETPARASFRRAHVTLQVCRSSTSCRPQGRVRTHGRTHMPAHGRRTPFTNSHARTPCAQTLPNTYLSGVAHLGETALGEALPAARENEFWLGTIFFLVGISASTRCWLSEREQFGKVPFDPEVTNRSTIADAASSLRANVFGSRGSTGTCKWLASGPQQLGS